MASTASSSDPHRLISSSSSSPSSSSLERSMLIRGLPGVMPARICRSSRRPRRSMASALSTAQDNSRATKATARRLFPRTCTAGLKTAPTAFFTSLSVCAAVSSRSGLTGSSTSTSSSLTGTSIGRRWPSMASSSAGEWLYRQRRRSSQSSFARLQTEPHCDTLSFVGLMNTAARKNVSVSSCATRLLSALMPSRCALTLIWARSCLHRSR